MRKKEEILKKYAESFGSFKYLKYPVYLSKEDVKNGRKKEEERVKNLTDEELKSEYYNEIEAVDFIKTRWKYEAFHGTKRKEQEMYSYFLKRQENLLYYRLIKMTYRERKLYHAAEKDYKIKCKEEDKAFKEEFKNKKIENEIKLKKARQEYKEKTKLLAEKEKEFKKKKKEAEKKKKLK